MKTVDHVLQFVVLVSSLIALGLLVEGGAGAKWGCVVGFISQPCWIAMAARARLWGVFILAFAYQATYARGIWLNFF